MTRPLIPLTIIGQQVVKGLTDGLVIQVLRVIGLGKEEPTFGNETVILDDKCQRQQRRLIQQQAGSDQRDRVR